MLLKEKDYRVPSKPLWFLKQNYLGQKSNNTTQVMGFNEICCR